MLRWYECLASIKPAESRAPVRLNRLHAEGWAAHSIIEERLKAWKDEERHVYSDPELPFDIGYHPDLYDRERKAVYDIKTFQWFFYHPRYCIAQVSGYKHFLNADRGDLVLYIRNGRDILHLPYFMPQEWIIPWPELKQIALRSFEMQKPKAIV